MPGTLTLAELDEAIAEVRANLRDLVEQETARSGAEDENRGDDLIAAQEDKARAPARAARGAPGLNNYSAAARSARQRASCARSGAGFSGLLSSATSAAAAARRTSGLRSAVARIAGVR